MCFAQYYDGSKKMSSQKKIQLFIFRHSESTDNARGLFSGWRDPDLTLKGISQAQEIAEQLKNYHIDYAFCSHLRRSIETLEIVLKQHPSIPVFTDDRLIERCYGKFQGKSKAKLQQENPFWYKQITRSYEFIPQDGESLRMVEKRITSFLMQLKNWLPSNPGNVAISCHGNSMRLIIRFFEDLSLEQMLQFKVPQNSKRLYELEYDSGGIQREEIAKEPFWEGVLIPRRVRLATNSLNLLRAHY